MKSVLMCGRRRQWLLSALVSLVLVAMATGTALAHDNDDGHFTVFRSNRAVVVNHHKDSFKTAHRLQVNYPGGHDAVLNNEADAYVWCNGCDTLSVAVQVSMFSYDVHNITLHNTNYGVAKCTRCNTVEFALQWVVITDDWHHVPTDVQNFMNDTDHLLDSIGRNRLTLAQATAQLNAIIGKYTSLPPISGAAPSHAASAKPGNAAAQAGLHVSWKQASS